MTSTDRWWWLNESLARPGGNKPGFAQFEYGMSPKWLESLEQVAPHVTRVGVLRASAFPTGIGQFAAIQAVASSFGVELRPLMCATPAKIESGVTVFATGTSGGLIVTSNPLMTLHREPILALAARLRLPAVYSSGHFVIRGGLLLLLRPKRPRPVDWRVLGSENTYRNQQKRAHSQQDTHHKHHQYRPIKKPGTRLNWRLDNLPVNFSHGVLLAS